MLRRSGHVGTVDTLAGPGYCPGPARIDASSLQVGGLAADNSTPDLWFESGPPGAGLITHVISSASVEVVRANEAAGALPLDPQAGPRVAPAASRLATDGRGGLYVATATAILHFGGGLTTVAGRASSGDGVESATGDGEPATDARFRRIAAIAGDGSGNIYVADAVDAEASTVAIRFLNRSRDAITFYAGTAGEITVAAGTIQTIAGGGSNTPLVPRLVAASPTLATGPDRLYLGAVIPGPRLRGAVRVLNLSGRESPAHGEELGPGEMAEVVTATGPASADASTVRRSPSVLSGVAADTAGNLFVAEPANHRVRRVDPIGAVTTFAGTGAAGFNGNDRPATRARLDRPYDVATSGGRVFISDAGNAQVRFVDEAGAIHAALGNGTTNRWTCDEPDDRLTPGSPSSIAVGASGAIHVALPALGQVHRLSPSGATRPVAGSRSIVCADPAGCPVAAEVPAGEADLTEVIDLAAGPAGGLFLLDPRHVRFLNLSPSSLRLHGASVPRRTVAIITAGSARLAAPYDAGSPGRFTALAAHGTDELFVADIPGPASADGSVREVRPDGAVESLMSAPGRTPDGTTDYTRCCARPGAMTPDSRGNLYIAATARVWFFNRGDATVTVHGASVAPGATGLVAGAGAAGSPDEGIPAAEAQLSEPSALALDASGNLYVADRRDNVVRRIDRRGRIETVVGTGQPGFNGDGLKGRLTALTEPQGIAVDPCGNLLIADAGNDRVRRLNLVASCRTRAGDATRKDGAPVLGALISVTAVGFLVAGFIGRRRRKARRRPAVEAPEAPLGQR